MTARKPVGSTSRHRGAGSAAGWIQRGGPAETRERAALIGLISGSVRRVDAEQSLAELAGLASAAGATSVLRMLQERARPDAGTFIGAGKVASLAAACA